MRPASMTTSWAYRSPSIRTSPKPTSFAFTVRSVALGGQPGPDDRDRDPRRVPGHPQGCGERAGLGLVTAIGRDTISGGIVWGNATLIALYRQPRLMSLNQVERTTPRRGWRRPR